MAIDIRGNIVGSAAPPSTASPNADLAIKSAVRVATTGSNIALSGLQTIDGIALAAGDRVLVKDQADQTTNGLYNVATGPWTRTIDAKSNSQFANGCIVFVNFGTVNAQTLWALNDTDPVVLGTTALSYKSFNSVATGNATGAFPGSPNQFPPADPFLASTINTAHVVPWLDYNNFFSGNGVYPFGVIGTNPYIVGASPSSINDAVAGHTYSIRFTSSHLAGSPITITYTAVGGDTTTTICAALVAAINANTTLNVGGNLPLFAEEIFPASNFNIQWSGVALPDLAVASVGTGSITIPSINPLLDGVITIFGRRIPGWIGKNGDFIHGFMWMGQPATGGGLMKAQYAQDNVFQVDATNITGRRDFNMCVNGSTSTMMSLSNGVNLGAVGGGGFLGQGSLAMFGPLFVNANASAGVPPATSGATAQFQAADASVTLLEVDSYGTGVDGVLSFAHARGTGAAPSNLSASDVIGTISARPYVNGAFSAGTTARIDFTYIDSSPNKGTAIVMNATPAGSTTRAEVARFQGGFSVGTTSDPGAGAIMASAHYGGSAAGSTLLLQSTNNGSPSGDAINLRSSLATFAPQSQSTITSASGSTAQFQNADGNGTQIELDTFSNGLGGKGNILAKTARGTAASPANLATSDIIFSLSAIPWVNGAFAGSATARLDCIYTDDGTHNGSSFAILATPNGGARATVATFQGGIQVGAPTGGDKGAGTINVATNIYLNNTAYTNPDYALEHYFKGKIARFADRSGAATYRGLVPLDELESFLRKNLRLPGIDDEPCGIFTRADIALEKIEEVTLYACELHQRSQKHDARIAALEAKAGITH